MRIVHYKSVAVKLVIHAATAKSGGFRRHADFHTFYNAGGGHFVRVMVTVGCRWRVPPRRVAASAAIDFARIWKAQMGGNGAKRPPSTHLRDSTPRRRMHRRPTLLSNFSAIPA